MVAGKIVFLQSLNAANSEIWYDGVFDKFLNRNCR